MNAKTTYDSESTITRNRSYATSSYKSMPNDDAVSVGNLGNTNHASKNSYQTADDKSADNKYLNRFNHQQSDFTSRTKKYY